MHEGYLDMLHHDMKRKSQALESPGAGGVECAAKQGMGALLHNHCVSSLDTHIEHDRKEIEYSPCRRLGV